MLLTLLADRRRLALPDLTLPWRPLYDLLTAQLFPKQRATGVTNLSNRLLDVAMVAQRFFSPADAEDMLEEILPHLDGSNINSVIAVQAYLVHFLPISKPQRWLPAMFKLWESFESSLFDDQMLDLLARLAEMHIDPAASSDGVPSSSTSEHGPSSTSTEESSSTTAQANGSAANGSSSALPSLWNEVGLLTQDQFSTVMTKALRSAGLPVGASKHSNAALMAQSLVATDPGVASTIHRMKKPANRLSSFSTIIVYSMSKDGLVAPLDGEKTPEDMQTSPPSELNGQAEATGPGLAGTVATTSNKQTHFLAGSRSLDAMARFFQATETYFHPSNRGTWQFILASFVAELAVSFTTRWMDEQRKDCRTPLERRLTPEMKKDFVNAIKQVTLLSLFGKDIFTIAASQRALKRLAILEPDLILPAVLERAYPGLEDLETTHRTTSIIAALSTIAHPMVSRRIYSSGARHLVPLLHLCLPAFDPTDAGKTIQASGFVILVLMTVRIDDYSRFEPTEEESKLLAVTTEDGADTAAVRLAEENEALRVSTAGFEDWVLEFLNKVFALFAALPEEGASGKTGGKQEESVMASIITATDVVLGALSPRLHGLVIDHVMKQCTENIAANSIQGMSSVMACCTRLNAKMVLSKLLHLADREIRAELANGASSARTTTTRTASPSDTTLHWYLSSLAGALTAAGPAVLDHQDTILSLIKVCVDKTKSHRGYGITARLVRGMLKSLISIYPQEHHFLNPHAWNDSRADRYGHRVWGKLYESRETQLSWHIPSDAEIDFAIKVIKELIEPTLKELGDMQKVKVEQRDKIWTNDFCRKLELVTNVWRSQVNLVKDEDRVWGNSLADGEKLSDSGDEVYEFLQPPLRFKSGFILTDPESQSYQYILGFRKRVGWVLYLCGTSDSAGEAEDKQDCVKMLLRSIRAYMTEYSFSADDFNRQSHAWSYYNQIFRLHPRQKDQPRVIWARRAAYYHASRARLNSFWRQRSKLDDALIKEVILPYSMSSYASIRKTAQHALENVSSRFDGTIRLCMPTLFEAIKPGVEDDKMKGALHTLALKSFALVARHEYTAQFLSCLLNAQHHPKPSLQKLVRGNLAHFLSHFGEPSTLRHRLDNPPELLAAVEVIERSLPATVAKSDPSVLREVELKRQQRVAQIDALQQQLVPELLRIAQAPGTHWTFAQYSAAILRTLIRRDQPISLEVAEYFLEQLASDNPTMRRHATGALSKIFLLVKLRTLAASDVGLVRGEGTNPLKKEHQIEPHAVGDFQQDLIQNFLCDVNPLKEQKFRDRTNVGWLAWGSTESYYATQKTHFEWDKESQPVLDAIKTKLTNDFWHKFFRDTSSEKERNYPASENYQLLKGMTQIYGSDFFQMVWVIVEKMTEFKDRNKDRAAGEAIIALIRGSRHWPLPEVERLWNWLALLLKGVFKTCTQDSQPVWDDVVSQAFDGRDPRRSIPLWNLVATRADQYLHDDAGDIDSLNEQTRAHEMLRSLVVTLDRKILSKREDWTTAYMNRFDSPFTKIRSLQAEIVTDLDLITVAPNYPSVAAFLDDASQPATPDGTISALPDIYTDRFVKIKEQLKQWQLERVPMSQGTSKYDCAAMSTLLWISTTLRDHRRSRMASLAIDFLPFILDMLELKDNQELSRMARQALTTITTLHYGPGGLSAQLIRQLLTILEQSTESWRVRLDALSILQVAYFQNLFYLGPADVRGIVDVLLKLLKDLHPEVREMAATSLSGIVRCSQRKMITDLKARFTKTVQTTILPPRGSATYSESVILLHSGILGATALLDAFPYDVPAWMPELLLQTVCQHTDDPPPISTTIKKCAKDFKRTHQDNWNESSQMFDAEQLVEVNAWALGRSDYFA